MVNMRAIYAEKRNSKLTKKESHLVSKTGIPFRHLTIKWESIHQMGVDAQPDRSCKICKFSKYEQHNLLSAFITILLSNLAATAS